MKFSNQISLHINIYVCISIEWLIITELVLVQYITKVVDICDIIYFSEKLWTALRSNLKYCICDEFTGKLLDIFKNVLELYSSRTTFENFQVYYTVKV